MDVFEICSKKTKVNLVVSVDKCLFYHFKTNAFPVGMYLLKIHNKKQQNNA